MKLENIDKLVEDERKMREKWSNMDPKTLEWKPPRYIVRRIKAEDAPYIFLYYIFYIAAGFALSALLTLIGCCVKKSRSTPNRRHFLWLTIKKTGSDEEPSGDSPGVQEPSGDSSGVQEPSGDTTRLIHV